MTKNSSIVQSERHRLLIAMAEKTNEYARSIINLEPIEPQKKLREEIKEIQKQVEKLKTS